MHKFNHDLLLEKSDQRTAELSYPGVYFLLDNPDLRAAFEPIDRIANAAKARSRRAGFWAVVLGAYALLVASGEALIHSAFERWLHEYGELFWIVPASAAAAGVLSVCLGVFGVMHAGSKRRWLQNRLLTERLRQFHFQSFIALLPDALAGIADAEARKRFLAARTAHLERLKRRYCEHPEAELMKAVEGGAHQDFWLFGDTPNLHAADGAPLRELFSAYRDLRVTPQIQYASYKLRTDLGFASPRNQATYLGSVALLSVLVVLLIHVVILLASVLFEETPSAPILHVIAISGAIVALAAKTFEEGLQPNREVERYRHYRSALTLIADRFERAESVAQRLEAMMDLEETAYEEMLTFLTANNEAKFVM